MEFKKGLEIIIRDLREAIELFEDISSANKLPPFQSELIKSKCRSAVDLLSMLAQEPFEKTLTAHVDSPEKSFKEKIVEKITVDEEEDSVIFITEEEVHEEMPVEEPVAEAPQEEVISPVKEPVIKDVTQELTSKTEEPVEPPRPEAKAPVSDKSILADKFGNGPARVSDKLPGINPGSDLSTRINAKPVTDINDAIGLNDKFFYIRELFGGNGQVFSEVVKNLNNTASMDEARKVIKSSAAEGYNHDAMNLFIEIVARKLSSNG